tara:strand:+ start:541 stop:801 length:261 start_codon:yes stop_codon:yes gene_type:complete
MRTDFQERFKQKYLKELEDWLTDDLVYYYLTGESVDFKSLDKSLGKTLLDQAWKAFPHRIAHIEELRKRKELRRKKQVQQFVLNVK